MIGTSEEARRGHRCGSAREEGWPLEVAGIPARPRNADEALEALERACEMLDRRRDPRAAFPAVYAIITREVEVILRDNQGVFLEGPWISRLAGRFCQRYLQTLERALAGSPQDCGAWEASYRYTSPGSTLPIQQAMLGLNAHISYDLAPAISRNIAELGHGGDARMLARYKHDHDAVNRLLQASIPGALQRLGQAHGCVVSTWLHRWLRRPAGWLIMAMLRRWRAQVWADVQALLQASGEEEREIVIRRMDARARRIGYTIALPSVFAEGIRKALSWASAVPRAGAPHPT